ncbi:hypothetical protein [Streptomyces coerulescens]|uniref:Uncharacterized protein n=1 Tax=Streptomyces coerulescens TaxID=29304 RepID=A0ABW0CVM1_STRCD
MLSSVAFPCARDGLAATLQSGLLGGHGGAGAWSLALRNIRDGDEQLMVETHEGLHHELQASTGYGLIAAMALLLSKRGFRPLVLPELFDVMVEGSRRTHEVFATTLSASLAGVRQARSMLDGNTTYLGYLARGLGPAGADAIPWHLRETASAGLVPPVRLCLWDPGPEFGRTVWSDASWWEDGCLIVHEGASGGPEWALVAGRRGIVGHIRAVRAVGGSAAAVGSGDADRDGGRSRRRNRRGSRCLGVVADWILQPLNGAGRGRAHSVG